MDANLEKLDSTLIGRREAIKRSAMALGIALSPGLLDGIAHAQSENNRKNSGKPIYLTPKEHDAIAAIAERIIPRTDTPGANDAGVPAFIDIMCGKYQTAEEFSRLRKGLSALDAECDKTRGKPFAALSEKDQVAILKKWATSSANQEKALIQKMRELTLTGYFTSELVGTKVLKFDPIPASFQSCTPLSDTDGIAWTI